MKAAKQGISGEERSDRELVYAARTGEIAGNLIHPATPAPPLPSPHQ